MDWIIGLHKAINYIEDNLTKTIDYQKVAAQSFSSSYNFQRVFRILCGFTIGKYIRNSRKCFIKHILEPYRICGK